MPQGQQKEWDIMPAFQEFAAWWKQKDNTAWALLERKEHMVSLGILGKLGDSLLGKAEVI